MLTTNCIAVDIERHILDKDQLRDLIVDVLKNEGNYSEDAVELLMMTAAVESKLGHYIRQVDGPALGIFQMEPTTHDDIHKNFLSRKEWYDEKMFEPADTLEWDLQYAILMARFHYLRVAAPLPNKNDLRGMASYYKKYYNTYLGKGTVEKAVKAYKRYAI